MFTLSYCLWKLYILFTQYFSRGAETLWTHRPTNNTPLTLLQGDTSLKGRVDVMDHLCRNFKEIEQSTEYF